MDSRELAAVLKVWRTRIAPEDVGLPTGGVRRTPGLRREEVAQLAGVSVDYLVRLEQARSTHPSAAVLGALARALRLSNVERDHLFRLAGAALTPPSMISDHVRPSVLRLLDRLADLPVLLINARTDVLAWSPVASALFGDLSVLPPRRRNLCWTWFAEPDLDRHAVDDADRALFDRACVADLHSALARYPDDPGLRALIADLRRTVPRFTELWERRDVAPEHARRKRFRHPQVGEIELDCDALTVPDDDQVLVVHSAAPGSPDAVALDLLRTLGPVGLVPDRSR